MQIQPVSYVGFCPAHNNSQNLKKVNNYSTNSIDSVSFKGFEKTLETALDKTFKTDKEVEKFFIELMDNIICDSHFIKNANFEEINKVYQSGGFRGLLHELWNANPNSAIAKIREDAEGNMLSLASKKGSNSFNIFSYGRHGFWNFLTGNKNAPHDVRLSMGNKKGLIEFGLDKKGNCELIQRNNSNDIMIYSKFHRETGNIKQRTIHGYGYPETTYYMKNGLEGGLDQFLYGGTANPNIW